MSGLLSTLLQMATPFAVFMALLIGALSHPQESVYWLSRLGSLFGWASRSIARKSLAGRLESRINTFAVSSYQSVQHVDPTGARIKWVDSDADVASALDADGDVVVFLNPNRPEGENLSRAALMYVAHKFIPRAKLYMTPRQRQSMDLFVTGRLLDETHPEVAASFFASFMGPVTQDDDKVSDLVEKFSLMDRAGLFFPVFVQELVFLGEKVALGGSRRAVEEEVRLLLAFLNARANRVLHDETLPMSFEGSFCKCGFVIVAKPEKLAEQGIDPYVNSVVSYANKGFENVYLLGAAVAADSIDSIVEQAEVRTRLIEVVRKTYDAEVQYKPGLWRPAQQLVVLLRSASVQRYMTSPQTAILE